MHIQLIGLEGELAPYRLTLPAGSRTILHVTLKNRFMRNYEVRYHRTRMKIREFKYGGTIEEAMEAKMQESVCLEQETLAQHTKLHNHREKKKVLEGNRDRLRKNLKLLSPLQSSEKFKDTSLIESYIQSLNDIKKDTRETVGLLRETERKVDVLEASVEAKVAGFGSS